MFTVYGLHAGDGRVRYVGITKQMLAVRLAQHRRAARRFDTKLIRWMNRTGVDRVQIRGLCRAATRSDLSAAERWFIAEGKNLLNDTVGGDGGALSPHANRRKIATMTGRKRPPFSAEWRANIGAAGRGRILSDKDRAIRAAQTLSNRSGTIVTWEEVLAGWTRCKDCRQRYGLRQMREHVSRGHCARLVKRDVDAVDQVHQTSTIA